MPENVVFCSKCGAQNTSNAQFCQSCGASVMPVPATVQPVSAPVYPAAPVAVYPPVAQVQAGYYAGFWIRFLAYVIDRIVIGIAAAPFYVILVLPGLLRMIHEAQSGGGEPSTEMILSIIGSASIFLVLVFVGYWLYEALLTASSWQGTVGKRLLRLKVVDEAGNRISFARSTGRFFAKILSQLILWIGFIMVLSRTKSAAFMT
jgi:uncharacterized RDD family membrane protein YckC